VLCSPPRKLRLRRESLCPSPQHVTFPESGLSMPARSGSTEWSFPNRTAHQRHKALLRNAERYSFQRETFFPLPPIDLCSRSEDQHMELVKGLSSYSMTHFSHNAWRLIWSSAGGSGPPSFPAETPCFISTNRDTYPIMTEFLRPYRPALQIPCPLRAFGYGRLAEQLSWPPPRLAS